MYDESKELATHAMSIFLGSLCGAFEQLIAFQFTGNSFCPKAVSNWLIKVTDKVIGIGLQWCAIENHQDPIYVAK